MTEHEPYSMDDLNLDFSTAEWMDGTIWVEGTTDGGLDISAGFEPTNIDPVDGPVAVRHKDGITFRAFGRLQRLREVADGEDLPVET